MRILAPSQHKKCDKCEAFKGYLRKIVDPSEKQKLVDAYRAHVQETMEDKFVRRRGAKCSEESASANYKCVEKTMLWMTIDGMDQAKYKLPRNQFHFQVLIASTVFELKCFN